MRRRGAAATCLGFWLGLCALGAEGARLPDNTVSYVQHGDDWPDAACAAKKMQSPINFDFDMQQPDDFMFFDYTPVTEPFTIANDGKTLTAKIAPGHGGVYYEQSLWEVDHIDFHSPSEHLFAGKRRDLEVQIFHKKAGVRGKWVIVSITFMARANIPDDQLTNTTMMQSTRLAAGLRSCGWKPPPKQVAKKKRRRRRRRKGRKGKKMSKKKGRRKKRKGAATLLSRSAEYVGSLLGLHDEAEEGMEMDEAEGDEIQEGESEGESEGEGEGDMEGTDEAEGDEAMEEDEQEPEAAAKKAKKKDKKDKKKKKRRRKKKKRPFPKANMTVPDPAEVDFNAQLQRFLAVTRNCRTSEEDFNNLPASDAKEVFSVRTENDPEMGMTDPLDFNKFLGPPKTDNDDAGLFYQYEGSTTLPPCSDRALWYVRSDAQEMSNTQLKYFYDRLLGISEEKGNYRNVQQIQSRDPKLRYSKKKIPWLGSDKHPWIDPGPNPRTDEEMRAMWYANRAMNVQASLKDYIKEVDGRIQRAVQAKADAFLVPTPRPGPNAPTEPPLHGVQALEAAKQMQSVSRYMAAMAGYAVADAKLKMQKMALNASAAMGEKVAEEIEKHMYVRLTTTPPPTTFPVEVPASAPWPAPMPAPAPAPMPMPAPAPAPMPAPAPAPAPAGNLTAPAPAPEAAEEPE